MTNDACAVRSTARSVVACALACALVPTVWAQGHEGHRDVVPAAPSPDVLLQRWRQANDAVGQFPRGHADVLRWEQAQQPQRPATQAWANAVLDRARAVQWALRDAPAWLARPGLSKVERAQLQRQVRGRALDAERAWIDAVVSRQALVHSRQALEAAELGAELARRMRELGHWSRARTVPEELPVWQARARLAQAERFAAQSLERLWQQIGMTMSAQEMAAQLPTDWAEPLPSEVGEISVLQAQALAAHPRWALADAHAQRLLTGVGQAQLQQARQRVEQAVRERAMQAPGQIDPRRDLLSHAQQEALEAGAAADRLQRQVRSEVNMAHAAYVDAREHAQNNQVQVLQLARQWEQETQLRYNGMLSSTWQLLASARARIEAVDALLQARRQAWHAHLDLQAVLEGLPYSGGLNASAAAGPTLSSAGH